MRTHMRTTAKHPLLLLLLYTDVNYQNEQNVFNVFDATRPVHAIYLACRVSLLGLALLLGFALLLQQLRLRLRLGFRPWLWVHPSIDAGALVLVHAFTKESNWSARF